MKINIEDIEKLLPALPVNMSYDEFKRTEDSFVGDKVTRYTLNPEKLIFKDDGSVYYGDILVGNADPIPEGSTVTVTEVGIGSYKILEMDEDDEIRVMEQIDAHAFDDTDMADVIMQYDHEGRVFARVSNGTLELKADDHGLHIRADLSGTEIGRQLYEEIKGGYTDKMSFGFTVDEDERLIQEDRESGTVTVLRTIKSIGKLYDVSAVSLPANNATEISARSWCDGVIQQLTEERRKADDRERQKNKIKIMLQM